MAWGGGRAEWDPPQRTAQGLTPSSGPGYGGVEMRLNGTFQIRCFLRPTRNGVVMSCINRLTDQVKAADNLGNFLVNESKIIKPAQFVCIVPRPKLGRMYLKSTWCMHWPAEKKIIPIPGPRKGNWKSVKSHGLLLLMVMQFQPCSRIIPWRMRFCILVGL